MICCKPCKDVWLQLWAVAVTSEKWFIWMPLIFCLLQVNETCCSQISGRWELFLRVHLEEKLSPRLWGFAFVRFKMIPGSWFAVCSTELHLLVKTCECFVWSSSASESSSCIKPAGCKLVSSQPVAVLPQDCTHLLIAMESQLISRLSLHICPVISSGSAPSACSKHGLLVFYHAPPAAVRCYRAEG